MYLFILSIYTYGLSFIYVHIVSFIRILYQKVVPTYGMLHTSKKKKKKKIRTLRDLDVQIKTRIKIMI